MSKSNGFENLELKLINNIKFKNLEKINSGQFNKSLDHNYP